jgi:hypothetical protein
MVSGLKGEAGVKHGLAMALAFALAPLTPAHAAVHIMFTGTIDGGSPNPLAGEPGFEVITLATDTLSVRFDISEAYFVDLGGGKTIAGVYHDPAGAMKIEASPFSYDKYSDVLDGGAIIYDSHEACGWDPAICGSDPQILISTPYLTFQDGALVGFSLYAEPATGLPIAPQINSEGSAFTLGTGFYGGALYAGPDYTGHWNFADAVILSSVPEPMAWMMMIAGFGLIGGALRGRATALCGAATV